MLEGGTSLAMLLDAADGLRGALNQALPGIVADPEAAMQIVQAVLQARSPLAPTDCTLAS